MTESPSPQPSSEPRSTSKLNLILTALRGRHGATLADLTTITGWQSHTVRAALTRLRQRGHAITRRENKSGAIRYHVEKTA